MRKGSNMSQNTLKNYEDIIHLLHHVSTTRPQMSIQNRAAQFSPFAALTGHGDAIREEARLTATKPILDDDEKAIINQQLRAIQERLNEQIEIEITYYEPDENKVGGRIRTVRGIVKKVDAYKKAILLQDGLWVRMEDMIMIAVTN